MDSAFIDNIFKIKGRKTFREIALKVFLYQAGEVEAYASYLDLLGIEPGRISDPEKIPFLPIEFFKSHEIKVRNKKAELIFESSGTSGHTPAKHYVADASLYQRSFFEGFRRMYGAPEKLCILALLPSYLEREASSLVYMMNQLIAVSEHPDSGFYLDQLGDLSEILRKRSMDGHPTLLIGVTFALLELAEQHPQDLGDNLILMETGGMKGRRKEMVRGELHQVLKAAFSLKEIHSEYGMTELLSQAYSKGEGRFYHPPWMQVTMRDPNDPLSPLRTGQSGGINVIDLANINSCSFVATGDLGKSYEDGSFEVLGRFDHSDIRGCNLMVV
jgi:phenylacetate-coenzyme A ligase PaaK-like adenylate-forming protein